MIKVKWEQVVTTIPKRRRLNLANVSMFTIVFCVVDHRIFVGIERIGAFSFPMDYYAWPYVAEKLNLHETDARNMADWLNAQMEGHVETYRKNNFLQQGFYHEQFLKSEAGALDPMERKDP